MATVPQYSTWFSSPRPRPRPLSNGVSSKPRTCTFKTLKISCSSTSESSSDNSLELQTPEIDPIKLAFAKAKAYKKSSQPNPTSKVNQNPATESPDFGTRDDGFIGIGNNGGNLEEEEGTVADKIAIDKAKGYTNNKGFFPSTEVGVSETAETGNENDGSISKVRNGGNQEVPSAVKFAMDKAKEYKNKKGVDNSGEIKRNFQNDFVEEKTVKKDKLTVSSISFVGLGFSDKKQNRGLPAGLIPLVDSFPEGDLPEVEIIVGDTSKFGEAPVSEPEPIQDDTSDLYKPKVSTWGVFPRPNNISKTYGGGKVIRPGEDLETAEEKAAKDAHTRKLLAAYRRKTGLNIDPKLKSECEKVLEDGDSLMDLGKLKEALPYYEKVMEKLSYQSELHGLAAIQWSICQDSLSRSNDARVMYEKLQSHPNIQVRKKAKQFMFGFQAMEMMNVERASRDTRNRDYQNYFEAFVEDKANYSLNNSENEEEGALIQALPYIVLLAFPIVIVLVIALQNII